MQCLTLVGEVRKKEGVSRECPLDTDTPGRSGGGGCRLFNFDTSDSDWRLECWCWVSVRSTQGKRTSISPKGILTSCPKKAPVVFFFELRLAMAFCCREREYELKESLHWIVLSKFSLVLLCGRQLDEVSNSWIFLEKVESRVGDGGWSQHEPVAVLLVLGRAWDDSSVHQPD